MVFIYTPISILYSTNQSPPPPRTNFSVRHCLTYELRNNADFTSTIIILKNEQRAKIDRHPLKEAQIRRMRLSNAIFTSIIQLSLIAAFENFVSQ